MRVELKCFAKLANAETCDFEKSTTYELNDGQTVGYLLQRAGIGKENVKIAFVNSRVVELDTVLSEGDRVGLTPAVGGM